MEKLKLTKKYNKYPEYKDSGVEWLGKIPKEWGCGPIRSVLVERKEKNTKLVTDNILSVMKDVGVIRYADKGDVGNKSSDRPENYKIVYPNDIVLNSMNLVIGSVGQAKELGVTSSVYIIYHSKDEIAYSDYYHNIFRSKAFQKNLGRLGKGIMELRESIKTIDLKIEPVPIPPLDTQKKIVEFLNNKNSYIDQIIEKKQKLIELLREKRTAVINHAVTKGLYPKFELVESGVEWLGKIPKGWKVIPLKYNVEIQEGPGIMSEDFKEMGIPLLRIKNLKNGFVDLGGSNFLDPEKVEIKWSHFKLKQGDLLISGSASSGIVAEVTAEAAGSIAYTGLIRMASKSLDREFLKNLLDSKYFNEQVEVQKAGTAMQHYGPTHLKKVIIVLPSNNYEQKEIGQYLKNKLENYDKAINSVEKSIETLQEFKSSLISNVVTGKIKI